MLIHPLTLSFDDKQLEASFLRDETSRLRVVDAYAIALHGITTIAAVLRDFQLVFNASSWQTATYNMATATRMIGANKNHFVGVVYIIFNLLCVSNPWLRWTPKRNTYLTAVRLALPLFHLFPIHATHEELSQSYFTGNFMLFAAQTAIFPISVAVHFRAHVATMVLTLFALLQAWTPSSGTAAGLCGGLQHFATIDPTCNNFWTFFQRMHRPLALLQWLVRDAMYGTPMPTDQQCVNPQHTCHVAVSALQLTSFSIVSAALYYRECAARLAWVDSLRDNAPGRCQQVANSCKLIYMWTAAIMVLMLCSSARLVVLMYGGV